jgi:hypothetical protein
LHPGGLFLASLREGEGEDWEHGESGDYRLVHFILGTMKAHPQTFIIIGLLRSPVSPDDLDKQPRLF